MKKIITKKVLTNVPEFPVLVKVASHTHFMNIFKLRRLLLHNKHDVFHCVCSRHYITQVQIAPTVALLYFEWIILLRISYQSCWFTSVGCDKNIIITGNYYHSRQGYTPRTHGHRTTSFEICFPCTYIRYCVCKYARHYLSFVHFSANVLMSLILIYFTTLNLCILLNLLISC